MLDKPDLPDEFLLASLQGTFNPQINRVEFLPLGADNNTAVYRAWDAGGASYFVRLRSDGFDTLNVELLDFLHAAGVQPVIPPLRTRDASLWTRLGPYLVTMFPYIEACNLYEASLPDPLWRDLGRALQRLHSLTPPLQVAMRIRKEDFTSTYRRSLTASLERVATETFLEPIARQCALLLRDRSAEIRDLVERAGYLAQAVQAKNLPFVLCHADLHAGNLLVSVSGKLYLIDWDEILLAPRERDLMYIGGGLLGYWRTPVEEEDLFYRGYGRTAIDHAAIAYYRYERILTDLAIYARQLLNVRGSRQERQRSFGYMASNFDPGGVLAIARDQDRA